MGEKHETDIKYNQHSIWLDGSVSGKLTSTRQRREPIAQKQTKKNEFKKLWKGKFIERKMYIERSKGQFLKTITMEKHRPQQFGFGRVILLGSIQDKTRFVQWVTLSLHDSPDRPNLTI